MAGSKLSGYGVADVNLTKLMQSVDAQRKGYSGLSLTNYDNSSLPAIAAGSVIEVNGALYTFATEEAITGSPTDGTVYIMVVPSGDNITAQFTNTAPTWSDSKNGWYDATGNYRYVSIMTKSSSSYTNKIKYCIADMIRSEGISGTIKTKILEIGDWNMDSTLSVGVYHGLTMSKIRSVDILIRNDADTSMTPLCFAYDFVTVHGIFSISSESINLGRYAGGCFDSVEYNSISFNRGWIYIKYVD